MFLMMSRCDAKRQVIVASLDFDLTYIGNVADR